MVIRGGYGSIDEMTRRKMEEIESPLSGQICENPDCENETRKGAHGPRKTCSTKCRYVVMSITNRKSRGLPSDPSTIGEPSGPRPECFIEGCSRPVQKRDQYRWGKTCSKEHANKMRSISTAMTIAEKENPRPELTAVDPGKDVSVRETVTMTREITSVQGPEIPEEITSVLGSFLDLQRKVGGRAAILIEVDEDGKIRCRPKFEG